MRCALLRWIDHPPAGTALIDAGSGRSWSYLALADDVRRVAAQLSFDPGGKALVVCLCRADAESVIDYFATLAAGHAALLLDGETAPALVDSILTRYRPDFVLRQGRCERYGVTGVAAPHRDLALLLSTSGSTGSPKMVRLSTFNLDANAAQIVEYLELDANECAVLSLPFHHAYGLSVINSHFLAGATVVLPRVSLVHPGFWEAVRQYECTSLAGVPYTFTILERLGLDRLRVPSLRTLTQAGGRMPPEVVLRFAERMRMRGGRLVIMYGQTEATARIAWLPPSLVFGRPGAIGVSVPRGLLSLADDGELIYEGQNVMLGYAHERADLAAGDQQRGLLLTGDFGTVDSEGIFAVTGRKRRIAKVCGQRVNLDELEALLGGSTPVAALEIDDHLVLVRVGDPDPDATAQLAFAVRRHLQLPSHFIDVREIDEIPRTTSGKPDYTRLTSALRRRS